MDSMAGRELPELHQYIRMEFQTYVGWFTFFITVLFTAMAAAIKTAFDGRRVRFGFPVYVTYGLFAVQLVLGIIATFSVHHDVHVADERLKQIYAGLPGSVKDQSPVPGTFSLALVLMGITLATNLVFWGIVTAAVWKLAQAQERHKPLWSWLKAFAYQPNQESP